MDKKTFSIGFVVLFSILTWYLWQNNDSVAQIIANDGLTGIFWYFISNPAYILLAASIMLLNREAGFGKNTLGAVLIILASDIVSYPRLPTGGMPVDVSSLASSDALVMVHLLKAGIPYSTAHTLYYLALPIIFILLALEILGIQRFFNVLRGKNA